MDHNNFTFSDFNADFIDHIKTVIRREKIIIKKVNFEIVIIYFSISLEKDNEGFINLNILLLLGDKIQLFEHLIDLQF